MKTWQAAEIFAGLIAAYPQTKVEPRSGEAYIAEIARLDDPELAAVAVRRLIRSTPFFPSIAEIVGEYQQERRKADSERSVPLLPEVASGGNDVPDSVRSWLDAKWPKGMGA